MLLASERGRLGGGHTGVEPMDNRDRYLATKLLSFPAPRYVIDGKLIIPDDLAWGENLKNVTLKH